MVVLSTVLHPLRTVPHGPTSALGSAASLLLVGAVVLWISEFAYLREQQNCCNAAVLFDLNAPAAATPAPMVNGRRRLNEVCATDMPFGLGIAASVFAFLGIVILLPSLARRRYAPASYGDARVTDPEAMAVPAGATNKAVVV